MNEKETDPRGIEPVDDGHTIANMNVEGMPWYTPPERLAMSKIQREPGSFRETIITIFHVWKVSMVAVAIISAVMILVVLLMIWFW